MQCCQISASLHCHYLQKPRPLGTFHGHRIFVFNATCTLHSAQPYCWLHFLPLLKLFHTDPAVAGVFAIEVVPSPAGVPWLKLAILLLRGSLLLPTTLLLLAFLLSLGCHKLVSDCMDHGHFHGPQYSKEF
jgi:hypothetical protein